MRRATTVSRKTWRLRLKAHHARPGAGPRGSRSATALASAFPGAALAPCTRDAAFRSTCAFTHTVVCVYSNSTSPQCAQWRHSMKLTCVHTYELAA